MQFSSSIWAWKPGTKQGGYEYEDIPQHTCAFRLQFCFFNQLLPFSPLRSCPQVSGSTAPPTTPPALPSGENARAQVRGLDQAVRNSQDGISMIQTAEGALNETHSILQRMRELSVQAANDTLTSQDRSYIQLEVDQLKEEVTRIATTTQFNKKKLLDGSASVLWSSDKLETKALVRGALRQIDQFGQKSAAEGNFKISIIADPGEAEIQKSDIFKIKHENVIMNVHEERGCRPQSIRVDSLPAGTYNITQ